MMNTLPNRLALATACVVAPICADAFSQPKLVETLGPATSAAQAPGRETEADPPEQPLAEIVAEHDGREQTRRGRILADAANGDLLLQADDGLLSIFEGRHVRSRKQLDEPFVPVAHDEMGERLLAEMPAGFRIHTTPHYVVCYNTSRAYAQWTSSLLERLYKAFTNYWENEGLELHGPEFPLVVLVFADRRLYDQHSREDLPGGPGNIIGYYSLRSNRINMFDLSGAEAIRVPANRRGSMREINQMLSQPAAVPLVATIVHEATHQIAFNCGLQTRYADIPLWLCEGMAVYFEAPDLASTRGWRGIGRVNYPRLNTFRRNLSRWRDGALKSLLADDQRFRDPRSAADAYADAWALNYFLIKYEPEAYLAYIEMLAQKPPLVDDGPQTRLAEFRQHFGDLHRLETRFLRQMARVK
jgi:hypothetical protein